MKKLKWVLALIALLFILFLTSAAVNDEERDNKSHGLKLSEFENKLLEYESQTIASNKTELLMSAQGLNWSYTGRVNASSFLANLMSQKHIALSRSFLSSDNPLEELANFNKDKFVHGWMLYNQSPDDLLKELYLDAAVVGSLENMTLLENTYSKSIGICINFANFNGSMLRLIGLDASDITVNTIPGHAYVSFTYDDKDYLFDNNYLLVKDKDWVYSSYFDPQQSADILSQANYDKVFNIYNDSNYLNVSGINSFVDEDFINKMNKRLSTKIAVSTEQKLDQLDIKNEISNLSDLEASQRIIELVYKNSTHTNGDHYNGAKYAFRSLLVAHPEYYLHSFSKNSKYDKNNHILFDYAEQYETVDDLLQSVLAFEMKSIYEENYRIMHPYEIILSKSGSLKDWAYILNILLGIKDIPSLIVFTDENSYLYIVEGNRLIDMQSMEEVDALKGETTLVFNRDEVYYPRLDVDSLMDSSRERLVVLEVVDED
jgi:hypothetical protein